jgi:hypothetical protein
MALLIEPTDAIDVQHIPTLIYGPPGAGKTSLAQTADRPLTLDFDRGIHRSFNRQRAFRFESWEDCIAEQQKGAFQEYGTLVIDTLGALLDCMAKSIMAESSKNTQGGGLSISGWGVLGNRFSQWVRLVVQGGQDIVMVCHEEEDKDVGGNRYLRPAMPGKMAYTTIHRLVDLMGHIRHEGNRRFLDFNPTELAIGKNAAGFEAMPLGKLEDSPRFLADLLAQAKARIGKTATASAEIAQTVEEYQAKLDADPTLDELNKIATDALSLGQPARRQVTALIKTHAQKAGLTFDQKTKVFVRKEVA